jgi:hypothetical protein
MFCTIDLGREVKLSGGITSSLNMDFLSVTQGKELASATKENMIDGLQSLILELILNNGDYITQEDLKLLDEYVLDAIAEGLSLQLKLSENYLVTVPSPLSGEKLNEGIIYTMYSKSKIDTSDIGKKRQLIFTKKTMTIADALEIARQQSDKDPIIDFIERYAQIVGEADQQITRFFTSNLSFVDYKGIENGVVGKSLLTQKRKLTIVD